MRRLVLLVIVAAATTSFAQTPRAAQKKDGKPQIINFEPDQVEGTQRKPDGTVITTPPKATFGNLIRVRSNFDDKLKASVLHSGRQP